MQSARARACDNELEADVGLSECGGDRVLEEVEAALGSSTRVQVDEQRLREALQRVRTRALRVPRRARARLLAHDRRH